MVPRPGLGGCTPSPTKLSEEPSRMTHAISRLILVKIGEMQLGRISLKMMWNLLAPSASAELTKNSFRRVEASP